MDQSITRDLLSVFRQLDEIRGIVQIIEPAPPCPKCVGFGRIDRRPSYITPVCPWCRGTGWGNGRG